jgi:hypothetical protein
LSNREVRYRLKGKGRAVLGIVAALALTDLSPDVKLCLGKNFSSLNDLAVESRILNHGLPKP